MSLARYCFNLGESNSEILVVGGVQIMYTSNFKGGGADRNLQANRLQYRPRSRSLYSKSKLTRINKSLAGTFTALHSPHKLMI